jgi:hypothetical protein
MSLRPSFEGKPRKEQRQIPHAFAGFSLSIEERRFEKRVRLDGHFGDFPEPVATRVTDAIHVVDVREVGQNGDEMLRSIRVMQLNAAFAPLPGKIVRQRVLCGSSPALWAQRTPATDSARPRAGIQLQT